MKIVKPFVKWAGGKNSLIPQLTKYYPLELKDGTIERYIEPFVGGGAVLIDILQKYEVNEAYAFDINKDLINCYNVIKTNVENLIQELDKKEKEFLFLDNDARQQYFYNIRTEYNSYILNEDINVKRASEFIFLNRTCFNGLYRVNKDGKFNVPCGKYKNPTICDSNNLRNLSKQINKILSKIFEYDNSEFIDEYEEDGRIKLKDVTFIIETKGLNHEIVGHNVSDAYNHLIVYEDKLEQEHIFENAKCLFFVAYKRNKPLNERTTIKGRIEKIAIANNTLIIDTKVFLNIFEDFLNKEITKEEIRELFKENNGILLYTVK